MLHENENFILVNKTFPHIGEKILWTWGHDECSKYLNSLFTDSRDGKRQGFPPEIAKALFKLASLHDELFPRSSPPLSWHDNNYR